MPSSMTHTYFGIDVYNKLNKACQKKINNNLEYYKLFCQGTDPFMFYHFLIGKKAKEMGEIQKILHTTKTREFFITTINYINDNNLNNTEVITYLYGYICHYFLDLYTHPLIYYKSGIFKSNDKNTYKYNGLHQKIEYAIDLYFINKKEPIKANKFLIYKKIFDVKDLTKDLDNIINKSIGEVYSINDASNKYRKSIWYMTKFFKYANYDPYKIKLIIYNLLDKITPNSILKVSELSYSNQYKDINNYMNLDNKIWYLPWDNTKTYTTSFIDLYNIALKDAVNTIEEVTKMLDNKNINNKKLNLLFKDLSFKTGINCNKEVEFKHFEH